MSSTRSARRALLVDVGNSRVKWRVAGGDAEGVCPLDALSDGAPLAWHSLKKPDWVMISVVSAGGLREGLRRWCVAEWRIEPRFADSVTPVPGLRNAYADPAQLGVDRWLALVAARRLADGPVVVVDCGTAITMDLLDEAGVFRGGMIIPGRRILESAFSTRVPYLDAAAARAPSFPANNTADAIALGIQTAVVASLERFTDNARALVGRDSVVRLTGGDGPWLSALWGGDSTVHENLVLDGLNSLMEL